MENYILKNNLRKIKDAINSLKKNHDTTKRKVDRLESKINREEQKQGNKLLDALENNTGTFKSYDKDLNCSEDTIQGIIKNIKKICYLNKVYVDSQLNLGYNKYVVSNSELNRLIETTKYCTRKESQNKIRELEKDIVELKKENEDLRKKNMQLFWNTVSK